MKAVKLAGGLGNQMFQYAFAKAHQHKHKTPVLFDKTVYHPAYNRSFDLAHFNCKMEFTTPAKNRWPKILRKLLKRDGKKFKSNFGAHYFNDVKESHGLKFYPHLLENTDNAYYAGCFQSEKYFIDIRDILLKDFTLKEKLNAANSAILEDIKSKNSVSLHIRRGDYITVNNGIHFAVEQDYYQKAVSYIAEKIKYPYFFVFSDDAKWCKENLKLELPMQIVNINDALHGFYDLELMKNCKHNIIANSTLSWWGAWLNENRDKVVIMPQKWNLLDTSTYENIFPQGWIKL
ncbi:MAG: alpha-1,2-fucosyltransferase [Elusimicrobia bacterium]|nr:alpha-1,2-fucosyltransferase [Elusimicrobiota bacterium]